MKSGHEHVFSPPASIFLSIFPSPSVCLPPRSLPLCSSPHPCPSSCVRFFFIFPSSVFMQLSAEPKNLPALLSSMIAFHPSPSFSHYLSLPSVSLCAHICDQITRHIMGLVSLMACIKVGEHRDGKRVLMSIS